MSGRLLFKKFQFLLKIFGKIFSILPSGLLNFLLRFTRNTSGKFGLAIRYILASNLLKICGENVSIHPGVYLFGLKSIEIGSNVSIHPMCYIDGTGGLTIGNDVSIAHASSILTTNHGWEDKNVAIKYNKVTLAQVAIGNDVWIASGCRILGGVTIGNRSIVAAGAVVTKSIAPNSIVGGIPAKVIKSI